MVETAQACSVHVRGVVQGVGFRPFVYRLARSRSLSGWVLNHENGVEIYVEGEQIDDFLRDLVSHAPAAANIASVNVEPAEPKGLRDFTIRTSERRATPAARISPDLPVCGACLRELFDSNDPRFGYPYINCTNCGPRYSILLALPYDRANTTMKDWRMDARCSLQYQDPEDRRFHAQPVACGNCGPHYYLKSAAGCVEGGNAAIQAAAAMLGGGSIVAVKGIGGYHLACDALNPAAVEQLRERKFRKEKPFAVMTRHLDAAREIADVAEEAERLLTSQARPIVLVASKAKLDGVAPDTRELGIMLPYTPVHHLLFAAGAPAALVMTSANRSSEPIAYTDEDAQASLKGIADAFLIGERPIARRMDDSVVRVGAFGPAILRRARGYAPAVVARIPRTTCPMLALGADLKNTIALSVDGDVVVSQHIGDLDHYPALQAFHECINDLVTMYEVRREDLVVVHDSHPQYASTLHAISLAAPERRIAVQHHRAHIASVLAEREEWDRPVLGVAFDGTGYGDDGAIWGGEVFVGSVRSGFERVAHLRPALLAGGDAAARFPVQAAAGFLAQLNSLPDLTAAPFCFPQRYNESLRLLNSGLRTFRTTSMGRLFDCVAALAGFVRPVTYEGQAAMWLEQLARGSSSTAAYPFPLIDGELDFRPALESIIADRLHGLDPADIARAFHRGIAAGVTAAIRTLGHSHRLDGIALSGGVFQNELILENLDDPRLFTNHAVPSNDGGISLGQIALAAFQSRHA